MRRAAFTILCAVLGGTLLLCAKNTYADHAAPPVLPPFPAAYTVVMERALERGVITYAFDATTRAYPGFVAQSHEVLDQMGRDTQIAFVEVSGAVPDVWLRMPADPSFLSSCGQGAAACIYSWSDPADVLFRQALGFNNWRSAIAHEIGHLLSLHEQYRDQGSIGCTFKSTTIMDCGSGQWRLQPFDLDILRQVHAADAPLTLTSTFSNGFLFLQWDTQRRKDGGAGHYGVSRQNNATRVSFAWAPNVSEPPKWVGFLGCGAAFNFCFTDFDDGNRGFSSYWTPPGSCLYMRAEAAAFFFFSQSTPGYWRLVRCV